MPLLPGSGRRFNLLWIFVDQLRYHSLSCHGEQNVRTPHLDRLAAVGVDFSLTVSTCPVCTPARGTIMTGQYGHKTGILYLGDLLPPSQRTVAHAFRDAGYRTSYVGKWHLSSQQNPFGHNEGAEYWVHPLMRGGFEDWYGFELSNHFWKTRYSHGESIWPPLELKGYQTDALTDLSIGYLSGLRDTLPDQPWFHVVSYEAPHHGSDQDGVASVRVGDYVHTRHPAPPEYEARHLPEDVQLRPNTPPSHEAVARSQQAQYFAMIENLDDNVGRLLAWLESSGQAEHTLVAFFSDHGEMGGSQGLFQKCVPYSESLRVPFMLSLPGQLPTGCQVTAPACLADIYPTCASVCGVPVDAAVQGLDLSPSWTGGGEVLPREAVLSQWFGNPRYHPLAEPGPQWRAVCTERHTYAVFDDGRGLLFDDHADPYQMRNLWHLPGCRDLENRMHARLLAELARNAEPVPDYVMEHGRLLAAL